MWELPHKQTCTYAANRTVVGHRRSFSAGLEPVILSVDLQIAGATHSKHPVFTNKRLGLAGSSPQCQHFDQGAEPARSLSIRRHIHNNCVHAILHPVSDLSVLQSKSTRFVRHIRCRPPTSSFRLFSPQ